VQLNKLGRSVPDDREAGKVQGFSLRVPAAVGAASYLCGCTWCAVQLRMLKGGLVEDCEAGKV
jgi:hypothetical protein